MARSESDQWQQDREFHESLFDRVSDGAGATSSHSSSAEEVKTAPIFSAKVLEHATGFLVDALPQYGLLAKVLETYPKEEKPATSGDASDDNTQIEDANIYSERGTSLDDSRLFININAPWSAFICGSQGSGKSHTLSCILEASLEETRLGPLPKPLSGMVFHWDKLSGNKSTQVCEAAYLASSGIPVRVIVSPTSFHRMKRVYENLPGFPADAEKPTVLPFFLKEEDLSSEHMMKLMAVDSEGRSSLYMESIHRILRSLALRNPDASGIDYKEFKRHIDMEDFNPNQTAMIKLRLGLLESFLHQPGVGVATFSKRQRFREAQSGKAGAKIREDITDSELRAALGEAVTWSSEPGSLTIVDLSCPFVDESLACTLFNISLALFLEERGESGRVIALDEAHKFMTGSSAGNTLTESLLSVIRQQRHLASRIIIATQEPTISPALLDLCSMTIVHGFTSPAWLKSLENHLAGVSLEEESNKGMLQKLFNHIVRLRAGQALLFSPSAMLDVGSNGDAMKVKVEKAGTRYMKVAVRNRITADGGKSLMATDREGF